MRREGDVFLRIQSKYIINENGCWEWCAYITPDGYGQFWYKGKDTTAHRVMYELMNGKIPPKMDIDHLCRNRKCVNPAHLEAVTRKENARRGLRGALTTHCPQGHPYNQENTLIGKRSDRQCRACHREYARKRYNYNPQNYKYA